MPAGGRGQGFLLARLDSNLFNSVISAGANFSLLSNFAFRKRTRLWFGFAAKMTEINFSASASFSYKGLVAGNADL